jgi:hypothetical protein
MQVETAEARVRLIHNGLERLDVCSESGSLAASAVQPGERIKYAQDGGGEVESTSGERDHLLVGDRRHGDIPKICVYPDGISSPRVDCAGQAAD